MGKCIGKARSEAKASGNPKLESVAVWGRDSQSVWFKDELHEWPYWLQAMKDFKPPESIMPEPRDTRTARKRSVELDAIPRTSNIKRTKTDSNSSTKGDDNMEDG